jgi:hypothetical protein
MKAVHKHIQFESPDVSRLACLRAGLRTLVAAKRFTMLAPDRKIKSVSDSFIRILSLPVCSNKSFSQIAFLRDLGSHQKKIVHADDTGPHVAKCAMKWTNHNSLKSAPHPPDSPDFTSYDFCRFGYVKHQLQGQEFTEGA